MFTAFDKALAALLGSIVYFLQMWLKVDLSFITAETIQSIIPIVTPFLVWLVPNKEKPARAGP